MRNASLNSAENERRQRRALSKLSALRQDGREEGESAEHYLSECRELCCDATDGLEFNAVRAVVWKDLVLGLGTTTPVPQLDAAIIKKKRPERMVGPQAEEEDEEAAVEGGASAVDGEDTSGQSSSQPKTLPTAISTEGAETQSPALTTTAAATAANNGNDNGGDAHLQRKPSALEEESSLSSAETPRPSSGSSVESSPRLPDNCQPRIVDADIQRSLWALYPETTERDAMRQQLRETLLRVLANNPSRFYYQGLHELMGVVMYVLAPYVPRETIVSVCEGLLRTRWRCFSEERLTHSEALLYAMHAVVAEQDAPLAMALEGCGVAPESHYAVSWIITWYAHGVPDTTLMGRLFDYFIAEEDGLNVVFFTAAFVVRERERIAQWIADAEAEGSAYEGDGGVVTMAKVYAQLTKLPTAALATTTVEVVVEIIEAAQQLRGQHLELAMEEQRNFLNGEVRKLGYLANQRTRNAALRLIWALLPREWRNPVKRRQGVNRMVLLASAVLGATLVVMSSKSNPDWSGSFFR